MSLTHPSPSAEVLLVTDAFDRELLGVFLALPHFRFELKGRYFIYGLIIFPWYQLSHLFLRRGPPVNNANYPISQNSPVISTIHLELQM